MKQKKWSTICQLYSMQVSDINLSEDLLASLRSIVRKTTKKTESADHAEKSYELLKQAIELSQKAYDEALQIGYGNQI